MSFLDSTESDFSKIIRADFSIFCSITKGNTTIETKGIFDETYLEIDPDTQTEVLSKNPRILIFEKDLEFEIEQNDIFTIKGKNYKAIKPQPDGQGSVLVRLHATE